MCSGVNLACVSDCLEHQEMNMETVNTSEEKEPIEWMNRDSSRFLWYRFSLYTDLELSLTIKGD